jgi:hypothetical protein
VAKRSLPGDRSIPGYTWTPPEYTSAPPGNAPLYPYVAPVDNSIDRPTQAHGLSLAAAGRIHNTLQRPLDQKDFYPRANVGRRVVNPYLVPSALQVAQGVTLGDPFSDPFPTVQDVADLGPYLWAEAKRRITTDPGFIPPINPQLSPNKAMGVGVTGPRRGLK